LETAPRPPQTVTVSRTFGGVVETLPGLQDAMRWYLTRAAEKLRRSGLAAGVVSVFVMTDRFRETEPQYANAATVELALPTAATLELLRYAQAGVERIYRPGYGYRRAGVTLSNLQPQNQLNLPLFDQDAWLKGNTLAEVVDGINLRWGRDAVRYGLAKEKEQKWPSRAGRRSPRYTTCWPELFAVHG
jgi:DNA polymerase V